MNLGAYANITILIEYKHTVEILTINTAMAKIYSSINGFKDNSIGL